MMDVGDADLLRDQNQKLKSNLTELRESYDELKDECHFHKVKVSELTEIMTLKAKDEIHEKLLSKSLRNAELSTEVDRLTMELKQATSCVQKLGEQREENKRMLLELSDIVRTLQSVKVDYRASQSKDSYLSSQELSLRNVKRKVETIMEDRRLLVMRCKDLEKQNKTNVAQIAALEAQFHLLNRQNSSRKSGRIGFASSAVTTSGFSFESSSSQASSSSSNFIKNENIGTSRMIVLLVCRLFW